MAPFPYLQAAVAFELAAYVFESVLDWRQYRALLSVELPGALLGVASPEKFHRARSYSLDKMRFHVCHSAFGAASDAAILLLKLMPWAWEYSAGAMARLGLGLDERNEVAHSLAFLACSTLYSQVVETPFSLYSQFVIEARHGFNKQTARGFVKDELLSLALQAVLGPPLVAAFIWLVKAGGPFLALHLWLFMCLVSLLMMVLYPAVIAPLFNKFTPLSEGSLRTKIEDLASSLKFPLTKLYVIDGSVRSSHSNAYMYGFYKSKRIVLYDTLISQCADNEDEVVAVVAHELGHWKLRHTMFSFIATQVLSLLYFGLYAYARQSRALFRSFGFSTEPVIIGFLLSQMIAAPIAHVLSFVLNAISRKFEFQADAFARGLGYKDSLRNGLIKLQEENLSAMNNDVWYSTYHFSHPPLVERLAALEDKDKKDQ